MAASARLSPKWAMRMVGVALAFSAFGGWCLADATRGYPRFNLRAAEYNRLRLAGQEEDWPALASERGWKAAFRQEDHLPNGLIALKTSWDIGTQYVMLAGCLAVALLAVIRLLRAKGRTMRADEDGFLTIEGLRVPYHDIVGIDLKLWQRKSIAQVHCRFRDRLLVTRIDDWIYQGGEDVLAEIQRRTGSRPDGALPDAAEGSAPTLGVRLGR